MKIGILGGAFNPPHIGHLILAQEILETLGLDKVFFIPANISPHKQVSNVDAESRLEMTILATTGNKNFEVLDLEVKRGGTSFTIDTIRELKKSYPDDEFYLIIGSDLAETFSTWKNYQDLKKEVKIAVANRKEYPFLSQPQPEAGQLQAEEAGRPLAEKGEDSYLVVDIRQIGVSSSQIRELVKNKRSIRYLVKEKVADYMQQHNLFKNTDT